MRDKILGKMNADSRICVKTENPQSSKWLWEVSVDVHGAYSKLSNKSFDVGNMDISEPKSHALEQGHVSVS